MEKENTDYMQIEITTRCNYTCGFCVGRHMPQKDMSYQTFEKIISGSNSIQHIEMQGEGEPLLNPDFFKMAEYARLKYPKVKLSFITNGSLFTQNNVEQILAIGFHKIYISIESARASLFKTIRGGSLNKVIKGIKSIIENRQQYTNKTPEIGLAVTVLHDTINELHNIVELYESLELDGGIVLQPLQTMPAYRKYYSDQMQQQLLSKIDTVKFKENILSNTKIKKFLNQRGQKKNFYEELYTSTDVKRQSCPWLNKGLYINYTGEVTPCCYVKDTKNYGLGSISQLSLNEIAEQRKGLATQLANKVIPSMCKQCSIAEKITATN